MKIYEIKTGTEKVWVAATNPLSAIYCADMDDAIDLSVAEEGDDICEIPQEKWDTMYTTLDNGGVDEWFSDIMSKRSQGDRAFLIASTMGM